MPLSPTRYCTQSSCIRISSVIFLSAAWLASTDSKGITGRVFEASGEMLAVAEGWHRGPTVEPVEDPTKLGPIVTEMVKQARMNAGMDGQDLDGGVG